MTVTGTTAPDSSKIWVIPSLRPMIPDISSSSIHLDLDVHTRWQIQLGERVDGLRARIEDVDDALMRLQLELLAALLVDVRRPVDGPPLHPRGERDGAADAGTRLLRRADDVGRGLIDHRVIEALQPDADLASHLCIVPVERLQSTISVTTPAPTVRPPSRIAKRSSFSMAMGVISSTTICTLSPGITISTPSGSAADPVTSVVRK